MAKLLINENNKLLVGSGGKAYAITNLDELKGATSPVDITAADGRILKLTRYGKCEQKPVNYLASVTQSGKCEQNGTPTPDAPVPIKCNNGVLKWDAVNQTVYADGTPEAITDALGNTATAVNLLGVGDYADTQEIISGAVARKVRVKVFDGTESITGHSSIDGLVWYYETSAKTGNDLTGVSSHYNATSNAVSNMQDGDFRLAMVSGENQRIVFRDTTNAAGKSSTASTNFKSFLAAQYAAGTPVIVVYPLATETTESVAGQMLVKEPLTVTAEVSDPTITTTETPVSTPDPNHPLPVWCNNGAVKVYRNLFDRNDPTTIINAYVGSSSVGGSANIVSSTNDRSFIIKTKPNTKYTIQKLGGEAPYNRFRVSQSSGFPRIGQQVTKLYENTATTSGLRTTTVTTGNNGNYIIVYGLNGNPGTELPTFLDKFVVCEGDTINAGQIYTDGTPEVLMVSRENLFDASSYTEINAYVNANTGVLTTGSPGSMTQYCAVIPCKPNTQYNITGQGTSAWGAFQSDSIGTTATAFGKGGILTTGANDRYLIGLVRAYGDSIDYRNTLVVQEAQTASVANLLKVGNYKDEVELISGLLTHKVAIKVLDGTESGWALSNSGSTHRFRGTTPSDCYRPTTRAQTVCTHFTFALTGSPWGGMFISTQYWYFIPTNQTIDTVDKWKAWLAAQYAAGTPVIVIYPLATPTTEQLTPQPLTTTEGTNTITDVAEVSNPEFDILYKI